MRTRSLLFRILIWASVPVMGLASPGDRLGVRELVVVSRREAGRPVRYAVNELVHFARAGGNVRVILDDRPSREHAGRSIRPEEIEMNRVHISLCIFIIINILLRKYSGLIL